MSGAVEAESPRPRPLSGGLWTLFAWLRREERSSSESLSSVGSARTAASFAYLAPALYGSAPTARLPPPAPPTDSYRKRVRDGSLRRRRERDLPLHRKYGLYGFGYGAQSLPRPAAAPSARDRRAASESPRAHVPGKRRAPPPPAALAASGRRSRKRPAPPPPSLSPPDPNKRTIDAEVPMSRLPLRDERPSRSNDDATGCKPEKYSKKEAHSKESKEVKLRHEKSFLKQIFDGRKRNSAVETASVKLLPSISELDKQAAEMIEKYRLKEMTRYDDIGSETNSKTTPGTSKPQTEAWICTICLRKYNATVITCNYCLPLNKASDISKSLKLSNHSTQTTSMPGISKSKAEDKEKLKEMLKEMKDSLPKRPKNEVPTPNKPIKCNDDENYSKIVEAPTLPIGTSFSGKGKGAVAESSRANKIAETASSCQIDLQTKNEDKNEVKQNDKAITSRIVSENLQKGQKERNSVFLKSFGNSSQEIFSSDHVPIIENNKELTSINSVLVTQPVVLIHTESNVVSNKNNVNKEESSNKNDIDNIKVSKKKTIDETQKMNTNSEPKPLNIISKAKYDLNTPLKISSLLNPIYIPKSTIVSPTIVQHINIVQNKKETSTDSVNLKTCIANDAIKKSEPQLKLTPTKLSAERDKQISELKITEENKESTALKQNITEAKIKISKPQDIIENNNLVIRSPIKDAPSTSADGPLDQHARKRDLINKLERSIATGDEQAAAEAAVKLAQLRLSCSVLSFSSQIVADASPSAPGTKEQPCASHSGNATTSKVENGCGKSGPIRAEAFKEINTGNDSDTKNISPQNIKPDSAVVKTEKILPVSANLKTIKETNISYPNNLNCKPSTSKGEANNVTEDVPILVWVEDKETTRGPVQIYVRRNAIMSDLRKLAEHSMGLALKMQRWIVGKSLCTDDTTPLVTLAGEDLAAPFYLCLVEPESKEGAKPDVDLKINKNAVNVYTELVKLEHQAIVANAEVFECGICIEECPPGGGVVLRECIHSFCRECLSDVVKHSEEPVVACPAMGCSGVLQEREVRGLVSPEDYEKWLARGLAAAESGTRNAFHCRTRDCTGWALCDPGVRKFPCPVCKRTNCLPCQAIHEGETCEQHRSKLQASMDGQSSSQTDEGTEALLNTLISRGEALECPECSAIITKKWGCDWVKCSACKTEICWVTKGRRWGPAGRGDTSAGCRCGVDGKRCHPSCGYCH